MEMRTAACDSAGIELGCRWFWKGGESLPAQAGGGKSELHRARRHVTQSLRLGYTRAAGFKAG